MERYWEAYDPYDARTLAKFRHSKWALEWPQSGERVEGHENDRAIHENYPGYPRVEVKQVSGRDDTRWALSPLIPVKISGDRELWVVENVLSYPSGGISHEISILQLRGDRVLLQTEYFGDGFSPPEWRAAWVEPMEPEESATGTKSTPADRTFTEDHHRAVLERYVTRFGQGDRVGAVADLMHEDAVVEWPQSRERIRGLANYVAIVENHPTPPTAAPRRILGSGDFFVMELLLDYAGTPYFEVIYLEFREDRVAQLTAYFAEPLSPPAWRSQWVHLMNGPSRA